MICSSHSSSLVAKTAKTDATKKAYYDKEVAEANQEKDVNSAEIEKGLNGIEMAPKVFGDYYGNADKAHDPSDGASTGIIGLLGVCDSDFSKWSR